MSWEVVIGLEIHVQLATASKIFSSSSTAFGAAPNTQADVVDLGLPGVLPVLNDQAVRYAAMFGLAVGAQVAPRSVFARKNYFYPDLPKGYQISQYELPIVSGGQISIGLDDGQQKVIRITRAHLEEDAGKSLHEDFHGKTGIDLNRAGTPLLEIVSEPEMNSAAEAVAYLRKVHTLVRFLGISDGNMEQGSFRADANVSVRLRGQSELGTRTEVKNINSFRFVERAIDYEVERHIGVIEAGQAVVQETRLFDPDSGTTRAMRSKEDANDYRYFPDPDLLPVELDVTYLDQLRSELPELPDPRRQRYIEQLGLPEEVARQIAFQRDYADYFETALERLSDRKDQDQSAVARLTANWLTGEMTAALNRQELSLSASPIAASQLAHLLGKIIDGQLSGNLAKQVFDLLWNDPTDDDHAVERIIDQHDLKMKTDSGEVETVVAQIVEANPAQVSQYRAGKTKVKGFFVGQAMKALQGKANPQQVNQLVEKFLDGGDG